MDQINKSAVVEGQAVSAEELALINRQSLRVLSAEDVFLFRLAACDNQVDRENERFTEAALAGLAKRFVGRPVICDHIWSAAKQAARVYAAAVEDCGGGKQRLVLRCYMLRGEATQPMIDAIEGGILRECSVGVAIARALCSVCGADKAKTRCEHRPGQAYEGQTCHVDLDGAEDAYEVSFVAVPAQPAAGVVKAYGGEAADPSPAEEGDRNLLTLRGRIMAARVKAVKAHNAEREERKE